MPPPVIPDTFPIQVAQRLDDTLGKKWYLAGCGTAVRPPLATQWLCQLTGTAKSSGGEIAIWTTSVTFTQPTPTQIKMDLSTIISAATPFLRTATETQTLPVSGPFVYHSRVIPPLPATTNKVQVNTIDF